MKYLELRWRHNFSDDPILIYSEVDENNFEFRKVQVYRDGRMNYCSQNENSKGCRLAAFALPTSVETNADPQFFELEIRKIEFEEIWEKARDLN